MPDYSSTQYWNDRYASEMSPYDWLFDYKELEPILSKLVPDRSTRILLIGAGNAPFSPELSQLGRYTNLVNIDISQVAIDQQKEKYPEQEWHVMDVMNMNFPDKSFDALIDKSLIDTILCYNDSVVQTEKMITEIYRIMAPGSRYITFSLHSPEENMRYMSSPRYPDWAVSAFRIKSNRWNTSDTRRRAAVAYTMVVCDRCNADGTFKMGSKHPLTVEESLTEEEFQELERRAEQYNFEIAMSTTNVDDLVKILNKCIE